MTTKPSHGFTRTDQGYSSKAMDSYHLRSWHSSSLGSVLFYEARTVVLLAFYEFDNYRKE